MGRICCNVCRAVILIKDIGLWAFKNRNKTLHFVIFLVSDLVSKFEIWCMFVCSQNGPGNEVWWCFGVVTKSGSLLFCFTQVRKAHQMLSCGTPQEFVTLARVLSKARVFKRLTWVSFLLLFCFGEKVSWEHQPYSMLPGFCWSSLRGLLVLPNPFCFYIFLYCDLSG